MKREVTARSKESKLSWRHNREILGNWEQGGWDSEAEWKRRDVRSTVTSLEPLYSKSLKYRLCTDEPPIYMFIQALSVDLNCQRVHLLFLFSVAKSSLTVCELMNCSTPGFPVLHCFPGLVQTHCPLSWWCHPTISSCLPLLLLPSIFPNIRVFSSESALHFRWPKDWGFSFSISPSNEYSGLISFRMDWFELLAVQGTLKSLIQHHSLKAPVLWRSAFFMVQLSHPYVTAEKTIALTIRTFVCKVMSLLFNTLSTFVMAFLPRINCLNWHLKLNISKTGL